MYIYLQLQVFSAFAMGLLQHFGFPGVFCSLETSLKFPQLLPIFTGQALEMPLAESMEEELNEDPFDVPEEHLQPPMFRNNTVLMYINHSSSVVLL